MATQADDRDNDGRDGGRDISNLPSAVQAFLASQHHIQNVLSGFPRATSAWPVAYTNPLTTAIAAVQEAEQRRQGIILTVAARGWHSRLTTYLPTFERFGEILAAAPPTHFPPNWHDWPDGTPQIAAIKELAQAGYPVCWVPRAEVIATIYHADPQKRSAVIVDYEREIIEDCELVLATIDASHEPGLVGACQEAAAAARAGLTRASQSLAASVVDSAVRLVVPQLGSCYYPKVIEKVSSNEDPIVQDLRHVATYWPVTPALRPFWAHKGDPTPTDFNRHASAHAVGSAQYTPANALVALMLATSMLRELEEHEATPPTAPERD